MPARVRKGDTVVVVAGDDRGKRGRVLRILPDRRRLVVEGVNLQFKHLRRSQANPKGGRVRREGPIDASNVMPLDPTTNRATRVAVERREGGKRVRVGRRSRAVLDGGPARAARAAGPAKAEG